MKVIDNINILLKIVFNLLFYLLNVLVNSICIILKKYISHIFHRIFTCLFLILCNIILINEIFFCL
jgi:hypothetical protein